MTSRVFMPFVVAALGLTAGLGAIFFGDEVAGVRGWKAGTSPWSSAS